MSQAIIESRKIADQIESGKLPPPSRAQAVTLIRQMAQLAERMEATESDRDTILTRIAELERENAELRKDAERLNFVQSNCRCDPKMDGQHKWWPTNFNNCLTGPSIRDAIDAAMKENGNG